VLEVRDQGTGIAPEHLERIFDPLFTTKEHGSGLGLTMVQDMVAQHGGHVAVESVPGRGTTFLVTLPAEQPHQASLALDAPVRVGHAARTRVVH
jgi:two-component system cell cycle sensor histidine kinase/response regulator CckA